MSKGAIGRRAVGALAVTAFALSGVLASVAAASDPPGWVDPGNGEWVAFTASPTTPASTGRSSFAPIVVTRHGNVSDLVAAFSGPGGADARPNPADPTQTQYGWPSSFTAGSVQLERTDPWCDLSSTQCSYRVVQAGDFEVRGGTPLDGSGNPDPGQFPAAQVITLPAPQTIHIGTLGAVGTAGTNGDAGTITLTAPGTVDDANLGPLTYSWVLKDPNGRLYTGTGETFETQADVDGVYCVELTVTASDGHTVSTPTCDAGGAIFSITGIAPTKQPPAPGGGGGGGGAPPAGGGGGGGGGLPGIGFSNPASRAPSVLTGGGGGSATPTVVWLWRPEWYQPEPEVEARPQTTGRPVLNEREDIVITGGTRNGSNAGPWLAGLGVAGLLGGGWLVSRRRRMRMLAEL